MRRKDWGKQRIRKRKGEDGKFDFSNNFILSNYNNIYNSLNDQEKFDSLKNDNGMINYDWCFNKISKYAYNDSILSSLPLSKYYDYCISLNLISDNDGGDLEIGICYTNGIIYRKFCSYVDKINKNSLKKKGKGL